MSNGTEGMRFSLVSRDVIADSIETVVERSGGWIPIPGCVKNMPGSVMAMGRLNRPAIMVYGGSIHSGKWKGESLNIVSVEALGKSSITITPEDFKGVIKTWSCARKCTANQKL
jgi:dihydroxy-acid dehydratase